jgi:hypothetical protein
MVLNKPTGISVLPGGKFYLVSAIRIRYITHLINILRIKL